MPNNVSFGVQAKGVGKASSDMDKLRDKFDKMQKTSGKGLLVGLGAGAGLAAINAIGGATQGLTEAFFDSIKAGSDLNETLSKSGVVFGAAAADVKKFGAEAAESMGLSENAAIAAASSIGNLLLSTGTAPSKIAPMSTAIVKLASDLASFNNISVDDALAKLQSGLVGQERPLRELGVAISAASVDTEAAALGFHKLNGVFSEGEKVQARYSLIFKQTGTAQGDFARTADQAANQQRILQAELEDTSAAFGQSLIPAVIEAQKTLIGFFDVLRGYPKEQASIGASIAQEIADHNITGLKQAQAALQDATDKFKHPELGFNPAAFNALMDDLNTVNAALDDSDRNLDHFQRSVFHATDGSASDMETMRGSIVDDLDGVDRSLHESSDAAIDWRDKYRDAAGAIIRSSHRVTAALVKDAAEVRGEVFDETEIRASLHAQRLSLFDLQTTRSKAKTAEAQRRAADDIIQALDDEGASLEDLAATGKITDKDVDRFTHDAMANYDLLSKDGKKRIQALIDKYRALAAQPNINKTFTVNYKETKTTFHAPGHGPTQYDKADGGQAHTGEIGWVGEKGPELVKWGGSGYVTPADISRKAMAGAGGGGGDVYVYNIYPQGRWDVDERSVAAALARMKAISKKRPKVAA